MEGPQKCGPLVLGARHYRQKRYAFRLSGGRTLRVRQVSTVGRSERFCVLTGYLE